MNIARDLAVLHEAGIDEDELIRDVAQFLRQHPPGRPAISPPLSDTEVQLLRETGAAGLDDGAASAPAREAIPIDLAVAHQRLVADAFSKEEVRARLGVVDSRVRQRVRERSLYAIERPGGRVFPRFQFDDEGSSTLPGLQRVLEAIEPPAHPVIVARFFGTPSPDLECTLGDENGRRALSPREWLLAGLSVGEVVLLAREL